jgi:predicted methyltransferase
VNIFIPEWRSTIICLAAFLTACVQLNPIASEQMATGAAEPATLSASDTLQPVSPSLIDAAISNPVRRRADRDQDERRKAAEVLGFFGIEAGMVVLDLYSGGGYYAELLSLIVGSSGRVIAHNNSAYLSFAKDELAGRYTGGRLGNVEQLVAENNKLKLAPDSFDAILMIKAYHDVYYIDEGAGWEEIDRAKFLHEIFSALKPDGVLGIIDHAADPGAGPETGGTLHRIDPALIKRDMAEAGFLFDGETNILRNPTDDRLQAVFAPSVRDRTDRVVLRFRKP